MIHDTAAASIVMTTTAARLLLLPLMLMMNYCSDVVITCLSFHSFMHGFMWNVDAGRLERAALAGKPISSGEGNVLIYNRLPFTM